MGLVTQSTMQITDLPGVWRCRYWYPSNQRPGEEDISEYYAHITPAADGFVLHSVPNDDNTYMQAHFTVDGNLATGTWLENTAPEGEFRGMLYCGVFQVIVSDDQKQMVGSWVGVGREADHPEIYAGRWEITHAAAALAEVPEL